MAARQVEEASDRLWRSGKSCQESGAGARIRFPEEKRHDGAFPWPLNASKYENHNVAA